MKNNITVLVSINDKSKIQMVESVRQMVELAKQLDCDVMCQGDRPSDKTIRVNKYGVYHGVQGVYIPFDHWRIDLEENE